ncbi:endolytic transglycosylase MltG [Helicobacter felis]|uniref:endolytic transglycosylase MltG n=1 Tax=Helicobacter felis TaxID=214 RepID=UPI001F3D3BA2|nr:endolytic transglycosylase MltG [Helicobacter felis]
MPFLKIANMPHNKAPNTAHKITGKRILLEIALIIWLSFLFYLSIPIKSHDTLYIPSGSLRHVAQSLEGELNGLDLWILRTMGTLGLWKTPKSGYIAIPINANQEISKGDFLYALTLSKKIYKNTTLIPGETLYFFMKNLAITFKLAEADLYKAYESKASYKEAAIIPDTYRFALGISANALVDYLLKHTAKQYEKWSLEFLGHYNKKEWEKNLIVASIVQKEAANAQEMPIIAGVIYNRLEKDMPLQMDGSLNYGKFSHTKVTRARILEDNSSYNTYKHKGLPDAPVGSVSLQAIKAAIFPAKTSFLYFVKNKDGVHVFSQHYSEHVRHIHEK